MSIEELKGFLEEHHLKPTGDPSTLRDRAARLKIAMQSPEFLWSGLTASQRTHLLQELLGVADVFCVRKEDL